MPDEPLNPSLDATKRRLIVKNSSGPGASAIQVNRLMLTSLGGYFDAHAEFSDASFAIRQRG